MRNYLIVLLSLIVLSSCSDKASQKQISLLKQEVSALKTKVALDSVDCVRAIDTLVVQKDIADVCKINDYYIVVGSFKEIARAQKWAQYVDSLGYTTCIVHSHNNYDMVYVKAGSDKKGALAIMENIRKIITPRAWVYVRRK